MDYGAIQTDKKLKSLEKKLTESYKTANKYVTKKLKDRLKKFEKKDKEALKQVKNGVLTQSEYLEWRSKYLIPQTYLKDLQETLATDMSNANQIATALINNEMPDIFALNANYATYEIDDLLGLEVSSSFSLYDHDTVARMMRRNPEIVPKAKVNIPKDMRWNRQKIHSAITQGILTGDSIPHIANRLMKVTDMNRKVAIRNARTYTTAAQNGGRVDGYKRAKSMGIDIQQQWMASLDMRTRISHRHLDGERVEVGEKFSNGLRYPADPEGRPEEVYNCRCTLVAYDAMFEKEDEELMKHRWSKLPEGMSYEEWKKAKEPEDQEKVVQQKITQTQKKIDEIKAKDYPGVVDSFGYMPNIDDYEYFKEELKGVRGYLEDSIEMLENKKIKEGGLSELRQRRLERHKKELAELKVFQKDCELYSQYQKELIELNSELSKIKAEKFAKSIKTGSSDARYLEARKAIATAREQTEEYHLEHNFSYSRLEKLPTDQKEAIRLYTGSAYDEMNMALRGPNDKVSEEKVERLMRHYKKDIEDCTEGLKHWKLDVDTMSYRGMGSKRSLARSLGISKEELIAAIEDKSIIGQRFVEKGFCSSAIDPQHAWSKEIMLDIVSPKGTTAMYVDPISKHRGEKELLFQRGTMFEILEIEEFDRWDGSGYKLKVLVVDHVLEPI